MRKLNGGTVLGFIALFVALSGGAYAAISIPKNSVTTKQVKDHSLLKKDFKSGQLPRGATGPQGNTGPAGSQGPVGPQGAQGVAGVQIVTGPTASMCADGGGTCQVGASLANCPAGYVVIGGGWDGGSAPSPDNAVAYNKPYINAASQSWGVIMANNSSVSSTVAAVATCAKPGTAAATAARARSSLSSTFRADVRRVLGPTASTAASARSYANCTALNKAYAHGVGRSGARDHTSGTRVTNFKVSNALYAYNDGKAPRHAGERDLDRDNDGIACEKG